MDEDRSTTPPVPPPTFSVPPPESSEMLQPQPSEPSQPSSAQPEVTSTDMDNDGNSDGDGNAPQMKSEPAPQSKLPRPARGKTPEPNRVIQISHSTNTNGHVNGHSHAAAVAHAPHLAREQSVTPGSPGGHLNPFDWEDLEARFEKALASANEDEQALLEEFADLVKYFNVWASTASAHDNDRAAKRYGAALDCHCGHIGSFADGSRLQTRTHFVKLRETDLASKRQHCEFQKFPDGIAGILLLTAPNASRRVGGTGVPERDGVVEPDAGLASRPTAASQCAELRCLTVSLEKFQHFVINFAAFLLSAMA